MKKVNWDGFFLWRCISEYSGGLDSDDVGTASEPVVQCCDRMYIGRIPGAGHSTGQGLVSAS